MRLGGDSLPWIMSARYGYSRLLYGLRSDVRAELTKQKELSRHDPNACQPFGPSTSSFIGTDVVNTRVAVPNFNVDHRSQPHLGKSRPHWNQGLGRAHQLIVTLTSIGT